LAGQQPAEAADGEVDLPALTDPAVGLQRSATVLSIVTLGIVALTAGSRVDGAFASSDVGALLVLYALATVALSRLPWGTLPAIAAVSIIGAQILFVVSLTTVTGGGSSPYFALYAPILALAGWHLRRDWLVLAVGSVALVEWWRAMVVESGQGSADQLLVALPFFAAIAALAQLTSQRLYEAVVAIRRDQLRTAETLEAVRTLASSPETEPLAAASAAAGRIFGSRARLVSFEPPTPQGANLLSRSDGGRRLSVAISSSEGTHGILELERADPFSTTEARLAAMLGGSAGQAVVAQPGRRRAHL
jgi:hypothetical protein